MKIKNKIFIASCINFVMVCHEVLIKHIELVPNKGCSYKLGSSFHINQVYWYLNATCSLIIMTC